MKIFFLHNNTYPEAVEYAFTILSSILDCDVVMEKEATIPDNQDVIVVSYGRDIPSNFKQKHLHISADYSFWENFGTLQSLPKCPLQSFSLDGLELRSNKNLEDPLLLPYVHGTEYSCPVYWKDKGSGGNRLLVCDLDLLSSTFFWITCYEESLIEERDEFGRIPEDQLLTVREKCYSRPLVDEYSEVLHQLLSRLDNRLKATREGFRLLITHDVDSGISVKGKLENFENGLRSLYREVVREGRVRAGVANWLQWFNVGVGRRSIVDGFRDIVLLDKQYGYTSHFFLMANGTHPGDAKYDIFSEYSQEVIREIQSCGGAIGLHLGLNTHKCFGQFKKEWSTLRKAFPDTIPASRSHYLVLPIPDTWNNLSEVNCRVDTTLGFSKYMGFRAGTSRPFRPFDVVNQRVAKVWEYPMVIMDKNLFLLPVESDAKRIELALQIVDKVWAHGGCLVVNWHNVCFFSDYLSMYRAILEYVTKRARDVQLSSTPEIEQSLIW